MDANERKYQAVAQERGEIKLIYILPDPYTLGEYDAMLEDFEQRYKEAAN